MPRAKRTDRAEARRRYRTEVAAKESAVDGGDRTQGGAAAASATPKGRAATAPSAGSARPGFLDGFRGAMRPADIRADIAAGPAIFRSSRLLWIPFALIVVAGVVALVPGLVMYQIPYILFTTLIAQPFVAPLLAGLFAPRAAWLFGLLTGVVGSAFYGIFLFSPAYASVPAAIAVTDAQKLESTLINLVVGALYGMVLGAFAGFYRRFLRSTTPARSPARSRRAPARSRR